MDMTINRQVVHSEHLAAGVVGFPTALATAVGLIVAGPVLLTATTGFGIGGSAFAAAVIIAYILMLCQVCSFSEAAGMIPTAGSIYDYISCGMGRFFAITGTLAAYLIVHVFAGTAEVAVAGAFAVVNFESLSPLQASGSWIIGVSLLALFAIANIIGIQAYGTLEILMTGFMWLTLVVFGVLGLFLPTQIGSAGLFGASMVGIDFYATLSLVGMAMFLFVGCEMVTPLAPEIRNSSRNIPLAMFVGVTAVCLAMTLYGAALKRQVGDAVVDGSVLLLETPMAIPIFAETVLGQFGRIWLGIAVLLASAATINTLMAGLPRILYGMATDGALPKLFSYLHPRFKTPIFGIAVTFIIPAVYAVIIDGDTSRILSLVLASVCAWLFSYILVNLSIIFLRLRRPDLVRPFSSPLFPLPQIFATLGMLVAFWFIAPPTMSRADVYIPFAILMALTATYALVWTCCIRKLAAFKPIEPEVLIEEKFGPDASVVR